MGFFLFFFFWLAQTSRVSKNARQFRGVTLLHAALHSAYFQCFDAALYPQPCASNIISWLAQFPVPSGPIIEKKRGGIIFPSVRGPRFDENKGHCTGVCPPW